MKRKNLILHRSLDREATMNVRLFLLLLLALAPLLLWAECKEGYQEGTMVKVLEQNTATGPMGRAAADDTSTGRPGAPVARTLIFSFGGKKYELRIPPGTNLKDMSLAAGQKVCVSQEDGKIHVLTADGKPLPGVAHSVAAQPRTAK